MSSTGSKDGATVMVAAESSFGSVDATDARAIDTTTIAGLTAYSLRVTLDSFNGIAQSLKQVSYERADVTKSGGTAQARVEAAVDGSGPVKRLVGTVTLTGELRGFGSISPSSTGLGKLLRSGLGSTIRTPGTVVTGTAATDSTFTVPSGDIGKILKGDVVAVEQDDGRLRFCRITDRNSGTYTLTTLEPHGIGTTANVRQCHMFWPLQGTAPEASVVLQAAHKDGAHTLIGVGGRLKSFAINRVGASALEWTAEVDFPDGMWDSAVVIPVTTPYPMGATTAATTPLACLVAPLRLSEDHSADAAPWSGDAEALTARTWSVKVTNDLQPEGDPGTRSGRSNTIVSGTMLEGSFTHNAPTTGADWRDGLRLGEKRAAGFAAAGANAAGNGFAVWIGAVEAPSDPGLMFAVDDRTQDVSFRAGDYAGDATGSGSGDAVGKPFVLAFVA